MKNFQLLNVETIFAERINQKFTLRRDFSINKNSKILIVEDVITTGKSSLECADLVNQFNANIIGFACIIDRSNKKSLIDKKIVSQVEINIPTYKADNLPKELLSIKAIKPGSRGI